MEGEELLLMLLLWVFVQDVNGRLFINAEWKIVRLVARGRGGERNQVERWETKWEISRIKMQAMSLFLSVVPGPFLHRHRLQLHQSGRFTAHSPTITSLRHRHPPYSHRNPQQQPVHAEGRPPTAHSYPHSPPLD